MTGRTITVLAAAAVLVGAGAAMATVAREVEDLSRLEVSAEVADSYPHSECFRSAAEAHDIPLIVLLGVAKGESAFREDAVSHSRRTGEEIAHGVMQIKWPETAQELGFAAKEDLYDPCRNIEAGTRYLRGLLDRYEQSYYHALAAYNYGPGRISIGEPIPDGADWYVRYIRDKMESIPAGAWVDRDSAPYYYFNTYYRSKRFCSLLARKVRQEGVEFEVQRLDDEYYAVMVKAADAAGLRSAMAAVRQTTGLAPMKEGGR